jgi:hypothetical protein
MYIYVYIYIYIYTHTNTHIHTHTNRKISFAAYPLVMYVRMYVCVIALAYVSHGFVFTVLIKLGYMYVCMMYVCMYVNARKTI